MVLFDRAMLIYMSKKIKAYNERLLDVIVYEMGSLLHKSKCSFCTIIAFLDLVKDKNLNLNESILTKFIHSIPKYTIYLPIMLQIYPVGAEVWF